MVNSSLIGAAILAALRKRKSPMSLMGLVKYISNKLNVTAYQVKTGVTMALRFGAERGLIQNVGHRYTIKNDLRGMPFKKSMDAILENRHQQFGKENLEKGRKLKRPDQKLGIFTVPGNDIILVSSDESVNEKISPIVLGNEKKESMPSLPEPPRKRRPKDSPSVKALKKAMKRDIFKPPKFVKPVPVSNGFVMPFKKSMNAILENRHQQFGKENLEKGRKLKRPDQKLGIFTVPGNDIILVSSDESVNEKISPIVLGNKKRKSMPKPEPPRKRRPKDSHSVKAIKKAMKRDIFIPPKFVKSAPVTNGSVICISDTSVHEPWVTIKDSDEIINLD